MSNIIIAYGSESGNARRLASSLAEQLNEKNVSVRLDELNAIKLHNLNQHDILLVITSSFGDGEPPSNANVFHEQLIEAQGLFEFRFAVFGLGDVSYPKFCGFSIEVDARLRKTGGMAIASRVDADTDFQDFFRRWSTAVCQYCLGDETELEKLTLQVRAYSENQRFSAKVKSAECINSGAFPVYDISIDIAGSGMNYRAGDLLYVLPPCNIKTLERVVNFYEEINDRQLQQLREKELRLLNKPLFRSLAKRTGHAEINALTKMSASKKLAEYIYGRDIADVLCDFFTPESLPIDDLLETLSRQLPRAYSIASSRKYASDTIRLCVREVNYRRDNKHYTGSGSYFLSHALPDTPVQVYVRANPHFHLPEEDAKPIIMIGAGTGIAPYLGFLQHTRKGEAHLFFGERHQESDFLYQTELNDYLNKGHLTALYTAFSRDQTEKIYVQDILKAQANIVWQLLEDGAHIYVCGSKDNLGKSVDHALCDIAERFGGHSDTQQWLYDLVTQQRYHQDLY